MQNHPKIHIIDLPEILTYGSIFGCLMKGIDKKRMKKKKEDEEEHENVDMISHLPDPLLHHIFSFLDIKQAIQTCILSRRWRYFWVSLPILNFNYNRGKYYVKSRRKNEFMAFVDRVLILRDSSNIQKLTVVMKEECYATYRLDTWIRISVIRNIQELSLRIYTAKNIWEFPRCLGNCKSLTKLVFALLAPDDKCTTIALPGPGSFILPRLKSLCIEAVQFGDKTSIDQFFSEKCVPVLETLILIDFHFPLGSLKISSFKLKHLRLESCGRFRPYRSEIKTHSVDIHLDSPNLISFYYQGSIFKQWIIENLSSLVKADINSEKWPMSSAAGEICYAQQTANILRELHNVEELTLSYDFLKISTEAPELFDSHSMLFLKLKCLKLEGANSAEPSVGFFRVVAYLLNACPNIETLCLRVHWQQDYYAQKSWYCNEADSSSENQGDCWGAGLSLECLKFFEFRNVTGCVNELKFIEILLNKAVVLEKLFIVFSFGKSLSDDKKCRVKFREKVLTFPSVSSSVAILFK